MQTPAPLCSRSRCAPGSGSALIEDPAPFTVEISRYRKYGELLKNSVEKTISSGIKSCW